LKKSTKAKILGGMALLVGVVMLSSCTANFCSNFDKAAIAYPYEQGVTVYCDKDQIPDEYVDPSLSWQPYESEGNTDLWAYIPVDADGFYAAQKAIYLTNTVIGTAYNDAYNIPSYDYWKGMDQKLLDAAIAQDASENGKVAADIKKTVTASEINPFDQPDCLGNESGIIANPDGILRNYGYLKFYGSDGNNWTNWDEWTAELKTSLGAPVCPNNDFASLYKSDLNSIIGGARACITTRGGNYGHYGNSSNWAVQIASTSWGDAWGKGFLEGLIVYPIAFMIDSFSFSLDANLAGWSQIWAIVFVTLIVRFLLMGLTFKSTLDQQKTQALQPQVAKLQAKYPNSNTNKAEAARLTQETMALYKRNKINVASTFIGLLFQFPVFIAVWGALQGSAVLSSGEFLHLRLSDSIQSVLLNFSGGWYVNTTGWWTAFVLFVLMAGFQWVSMMLPQWMTKARTKTQIKVSANPAQDKNAQTMKWVMYGMLVFTIIMGFALPAAMGVYWAIGAVISMIQTLITQYLMARHDKKLKEGRI
jgi:YidC/Oxa1 family membrane protein insertase